MSRRRLNTNSWFASTTSFQSPLRMARIVRFPTLVPSRLRSTSGARPRGSEEVDSLGLASGGAGGVVAARIEALRSIVMPT